MNRSPLRTFFALLIALFVATSAFGPAYANSSTAPTFTKVRIATQDGRTFNGRHSAADDFVITCPVKEVLDPSHPCSESYNGQFSKFNDLVLVCPVKEVLDPNHPCAERNQQIIKARPQDYVRIYPAKTPQNYVMTCPTQEVLEPGHPCSES